MDEEFEMVADCTCGDPTITPVQKIMAEISGGSPEFIHAVMDLFEDSVNVWADRGYPE